MAGAMKYITLTCVYQEASLIWFPAPVLDRLPVNQNKHTESSPLRHCIRVPSAVRSAPSPPPSEPQSNARDFAWGWSGNFTQGQESAQSGWCGVDKRNNSFWLVQEKVCWSKCFVWLANSHKALIPRYLVLIKLFTKDLREISLKRLEWTFFVPSSMDLLFGYSGNTLPAKTSSLLICYFMFIAQNSF